jgi:hypothetical protein
MVHSPPQQAEHSALVGTMSPVGTHAAQDMVVSSQVVAPVHSPAVHVTVVPQLSTAVPAQCAPQAAATDS